MKNAQQGNGNMENNFLEEKERVARQVVDIESDTAKHFLLKDGTTAEEIKENEALDKFNAAVTEKEQEIAKRIDATLKTSQNIIDSKDSLQIMPISRYMLIKPYNKNPYQQIQVTKSGFITDLGGKAPEYRSRETGNIEEAEEIVVVGQVLEVGPDVKFVKEGDDVYYIKANAVPIPFFKQGLVALQEVAALVIINEKVKERFNNQI